MDAILDVDTGVDDALALLLAVRAPAVRLLAVSCTGGNAPVDQVVANTLAVLDVAGAPDVPVARGMARPLLEPPAATPRGHGTDGLADLGLADAGRGAGGRRPVPEHAVELLRAVLEAAARPVTVIALARLTNLAVLLRMYPELAAGIGRLVVMGGSAAPGAEFNVRSDPEAAAVVFGSGLPILMYGLDVFSTPAVPDPEVDVLVGAADPATRLAGRLLRHQQARRNMAALGDAGALAVAIEPRLVTTEPCRVRVELTGSGRGQTVVQPDRTHPPGRPGTVDVAFAVDGTGCREVFLEAIRHNL